MSQINPEFAGQPTEGRKPTFTNGELIAIARFESEGHYWTDASATQIYHTATFPIGDAAALRQYSVELMSQNHDCQYGGELPPADARALLDEAGIAIPIYEASGDQHPYRYTEVLRAIYTRGD